MVNNCMFNNHLMKACLASVITIGLAACSSSDSDDMPMDSMEPTPQEACEADGGRWNADDTCTSAADLAAAAEATAITDAIAAARTAVAALTATSSDADVAAANAAITAAQTAIAGAEHASASDTVASVAALDAIRDSLATTQTAIDDHRADLAAQMKAEIDAKIKEVGTKQDAINAETATAGLGGRSVTATGNTEGAYNLAIKRDRDGTTVTVTVEGASDDDDEKFEQAMDLGGGLTMHTRDIEATDDDPAMQEVAMIMTDIEAPEATAFGKVHMLDIRVDGETATDADPNDALNVVAADLGHVKAASFVAPAGTVAMTTLSFQHAVEDDDSTPDEDESKDAAEIMGTYEGAMGVYKCNADAACTVTVNTEGVVSAVSNDNDWIFIPADGATVDVADAEYLRYGFWLKRSTADGVVTYNEVATFADTIGLAASGSVDDVEGTASYSGSAVGVYVHHVYSEGGGSIASSSAGHFTADANLKASFGGDDVAVSAQDRLTGTIDNFMLSGGEANDWSVALQSDGNPATDAIDPATDGTLSGTAKGGVGDGSFSATYRGSVAAVGGVVPQPSAVIGEFNADFSNGAVAGAFGANKVDE